MLALFRYRDIGVSRGGPIARLERSPCPVFGDPQYQAAATLQSGLIPPRPTGRLYGAADGMGTHPHPVTAQCIAISEALERWAFHARVKSAWAELYGFDQDPTSNGMAAYPDFFSSRARQHAMREAQERFLLMSWWEGRLTATPFQPRWPQVEGFGLQAPGIPVYGVILHLAETLPNDARFHVYGFSAGRSSGLAVEHAAVELTRNRAVLSRLYGADPHLTEFDAYRFEELFERRCVYFSTEAGYASFRNRLARGVTRPFHPPQVLFDGEIDGPWEEYTTVWRHSLRLDFQDYLSPDNMFFFY